MRRTTAACIGAAVAAGSIAWTAVTATAHPTVRATHPAAEHVPATVHHVRIAYRDSADAESNRTIDLHGRHARHMVRLFNALDREPRNAVHCLARGSARTNVVFKNSDHKWVATEAICTNLTVTRDGKQLPTLLESEKWDAALTGYLGHSPTGTGGGAQTN
ncbi:MAG TPA: hypothetical protein VHE57_13025 [Mycobacteriales bacterium]|nr:hypothetical protein [Mycobacteriales bacterium]